MDAIELNGIMIPMSFLILSATTWFFAFNSPDGTLALVLSLVPFTAPLIMFMRITVQTPPAWRSPCPWRFYSSRSGAWRGSRGASIASGS